MNLLPDYYLLLADAWHASDAVDGYDLKSGDPASVAEFQRLTRDSATAQLALSDFISTNGAALRQQIDRQAEVA